MVKSVIEGDNRGLKSALFVPRARVRIGQLVTLT